jgi:hypothetical protein
MHKLNSSIVILLLLQCFVFTEAKAQAIASDCLRSTIESYPGNEKLPVLRYLDEARRVADEFMRLFAENEFDEIYKLHKGMEILVAKKTNDGAVPMSLEAVRQQYGRIIRYEYRDQALLYTLDGPIELRGTVLTRYAIETANAQSGDLYMHVETHKYDEKDSSRLSSSSLRELNDESPERQYYDSPQKTCYGMERELKVRIPAQK